MFIIPIISNSTENKEIKRFNNKVRQSSLTDVVFISPTLIACADRQDKMLYLIDINTERKTSKILSKLKLFHNPDLMDISNNSIYIVNLNQILTVCSIINNSKLTLIRHYDLGKNYQYHGICINPYSKTQLFLAGTRNQKKLSIYTFDKSEPIDHTLKGLENSNLKDVVIIDQTRILVIASDGVPINSNTTAKTYKSYINLYEYKDNKLKLLDTITYSNCHVDSVIFTKGKYYVTAQLDDKGYLLNGQIEMNYLIPNTHVPTDDFPHGLAKHNNKIAYTCYSTSSVYIQDC